MLTDKQQSEAKKFLDNAVETLGEMLNVVESGFDQEDWNRCKKLGHELQDCKNILEV